MIPAYTLLGTEDAPHLVWMLHGVLGAGNNLKSLASKLCERKPGLRIALLDLRAHGRSSGASGPHTLEACVDDLIELSRDLGRCPRTVIGHSLGGKVALAYGLRHENPAGRFLPADPSALAQVWTLDSDPGAQQAGDDHQVKKVLAALLRQQGPFAARKDAVDALRSEGLSLSLANWLATSLKRCPEGYAWRFELEAIGELLEDYFSVDYWGQLEAIAADETAARPRYDLLVAENSDRWSGSMQDRATSLRGGARLDVHLLRDAGHWVHVDNPEGLLTILDEHLLD